MMSMVNGGNNLHAAIPFRRFGCLQGRRTSTMSGSRLHRRIADHAYGEGHNNCNCNRDFAHKVF